MKITKENIQFIDNYLKRNDVIYFDIRMEILDHAISGIENEMETNNIGFYDAFKIYMPVHKKQLLKDNNTFSLKAVIPFIKSLKKNYNLLVGLFTILLCYFFRDNSNQLNSIFWFLIFLYFLMSTSLYFLNARKRYFVLEKCGLILNILYLINLFLNGFGANFFGKFHGNIYTVGLVIFLSISFFIFYIKTVVRFNKSQKMFLT
ncbi:MAG: hypothetical protein ACI9FW_000097 [Flavobacterium sp.]|jgi:hypothetical protein